MTDIKKEEALAVVERNPFAPTSMMEAWDLSAKLSKAALLPAVLKGRPEDVFLRIATGHDMGLSPAASLRLLSTIDDKVFMDWQLKVGRVKQSPLCQYFVMLETTEEQATFETHRVGEPIAQKLTYTMEMAKRQGLIKEKGAWVKNPWAQLRARAAASLATLVYPDVVQGLPAQEELDDFTERDITPSAPQFQPLRVVEKTPEKQVEKPAVVEAEVLPPEPVACKKEPEIAGKTTVVPDPTTWEERVARWEELLNKAGDAAALDAVIAEVTGQAAPEDVRRKLAPAYKAAKARVAAGGAR